MERALAAIGARRLAIGSPYPAAIHPLAVAYFRKVGFDVVADATLDVLAVRDVPQVSRERRRRPCDLDRAAGMPTPSCCWRPTSRPSMRSRRSRTSTGRPLLSCNQTILWAALGRRGVRIEGKGLGRLFQHQPARQELVR